MSNFYHFLLFLSMLSSVFSKANIHLEIKYTSIFESIPQLKLHHIVIVKEDPNKESLYAIDFTPINNGKRIDLLLNKNAPAQLRIRSMQHWSVDDWHKTPTINVNNIKNKSIREPVKNILNKWKLHSEKRLCSQDCVMNMYKHNCQHFSKFFKDELSKIYI